MVIASRFDIWLVSLDPTKGREIKKTRPCVIISPNELSKLSTVLVAPMTSKGFEFPCRVKTSFNNTKGIILLDHIRAIDKIRLIKKLGILDKNEQQELCLTIKELFAC